MTKPAIIEVGRSLGVKSLAGVRQSVEEAFGKGRFRIFFKVDRCQEVDSSGIGLVVNLYKRCVVRGGEIGFIRPSKEFKDVLDVANIEGLVTVFESEEDIQ